MIKKIIAWLVLSVLTGKYRKLSHYDEPERKYSGEWVNRGSKDRERWVWKEYPTDYVKSYICIHEIDGDYFISKRRTPSGNALENVECLTQKDEERAIKILTAGYEARGELIVAVE